MKKYYITACVALALGLSACSDSFLDLESPTKLTADDYYKGKYNIYDGGNMLTFMIVPIFF